MVRHLIAAFLLAAPAAGALAQTPAQDGTGQWSLAAMPNGCMVQATSPGGTMVSIWGFAGDDKLAVLFQNRGWKSLRDGGRYQLKLDFLGVRTLPIEATARQDIDEDGPGLFFTVAPGGRGGTGFFEAFASAAGMRISRGGENVDTLSLRGGRGAMTALAGCLADRWAEVGTDADDEPTVSPAGASI